MNLRTTFNLLKESFSKEIYDTNTVVSQYYKLSLQEYDKILDKSVDNHRGGFLYTSTLWRIRQQLGQEKTDKLVAETILHLNEYMEKRSDFYIPDSDEKLKEKIMWYDLFYGLIQKDKELYGGKNKSIITTEFENSNFPIRKITVGNNV